MASLKDPLAEPELVSDYGGQTIDATRNGYVHATFLDPGLQTCVTNK